MINGMHTLKGSPLRQLLLSHNYPLVVFLFRKQAPLPPSYSFHASTKSEFKAI